MSNNNGSSLENAYHLLNEFKNSLASDFNKAEQLLSQLKKIFISFDSFLSTSKIMNDQSKQEHLIIRETLEYAIFYSLERKDLNSLERYVLQLKPYYANIIEGLPSSDREQLITGLNLMRLLAQNRVSEFHSEIELIPIKFHENLYIKYPMELELYLMEGSYSKIRKMKDKSPSSEYTIFMDMMMETIRKEIADSTQLAYKKISLEGLQKLLILKDLNETKKFVQSRNGWQMDDGNFVKFTNISDKEISFQENSKNVISRTLVYAKDLETIV
jgi:26S proteasome regulatory subunit N12